MYVAANPVLNAITIGMNKPFIVLNCGLVDLLDEDELRFVIAHELGHALSGHAVYQTLLQRLLQLTGVLNSIPLGGLGVRAIVAALYRVVAQGRAVGRPRRPAGDPGPGHRVPRAHAAGQRRPPRRPRPHVVLRPGAGVPRRGDLRDSVLKLLLIENRSHPFAVVRATELRRWVDSGEYTASSAATTRAATTTPRPRSPTPPRPPRPATPRTSSRPRTRSASWCTTSPGSLGSVKVWLDEQLRTRRRLSRQPSAWIASWMLRVRWADSTWRFSTIRPL